MSKNEKNVSVRGLSHVFKNFCTWLNSQLSPVAKSGDYNDLSNKPVLPQINVDASDGSWVISRDTDGNFFRMVHTGWSQSGSNSWAGMYFQTSDGRDVFGFATRQSTYPLEKFTVGNNGYLRGYDTNGSRSVTLTINGGTAGKPDTQNITVDGTFVNAGNQRPFSKNSYTIGTSDMPYEAMYAGTFNTNTTSDSGLIASNPNTKHSLLFGIESTGVNRGIYDKKNTRWPVFLDNTDYIMTQCPTPPVGDNSNKLATTGWVHNELDSTYVQTAAVDQTIAGTKTFSKPIVGSVTGSSGSCTGNAATATNATYANWLRTSSHSDHLFHTEWDNAGYFWTYVTAGNGDYRAVRVARSDSAATAQACTGNAATATKLAAARTIALSGAATGTATAFDGSGNITIPVTALSPSAIRAQWYAAYPDGAEAHNAMWGGRDITAAFNNGTVSANIANGTFRDIFPGDYITKQVTISGTAYTVNWVIADCDYWINKGDTAVTAHHVAIVPQALIFKAPMNNTNTTEGCYAGSEMYKNVIPACATGIVNAFGADHILTFRDHLTRDLNASVVSSGITVLTGAPNWSGAWYSQQCNLMSEAMVYDGPHCASSALDNIIATRQMSAFRLSERLINYNNQWWWLRDVVSSALFAVVGGGGAHADSASDALVGVRPFALLV